MKKTSTLLFLLLFLGVTGCNTPQNTTSDTTPTAPAVQTPVPTSVTESVVTPVATATTAPTAIPTVTLTPTPTGFYLTANGSKSYNISDILYGLFLEDINYGVDGGLYAEMIKNRSFEFEEGIAKNGHFHGWNTEGNITYEVIDGSNDLSYLNANNPHYLSMTAVEAKSGIRNSGFLSGMAIEEGKDYVFSAFLKAPADFSGDVTIRLQNAGGTKV